MKKNDYVSVIIPYYNTKKYLEPLLKKLIYQRDNYYPETEIIVIDDCSTEDTSWLDKFDIVKYHNYPNKGVSYSRNIGLIISTGDYIQFVDSDDDITDDFLHTIYQNIRLDTDYSIYRWISNDKLTEGPIPDDSIKWNWAIWGYTFKRDCIGNVRFNEKMNTMEDYDFLKRVLDGKTRCVVDNPIYIYNSTNENSICHLIDKGEMEKMRK